MADPQREARRAALAATIGAMLMIAAQVGAKATRDALFLAVFPASELPKAMLASALLSAAGVLAMSHALSARGPTRFVPALFLLNGAMFVGEWFFVAAHPHAVGWVAYLHVAVLGSLLVSGFWSLVTERFDPHTAKRVIGRVTAGATAGGLIGGIIAERVATWLDTRSMLMVLGAMSCACAVFVFRIGDDGTHPHEPGSALDGWRHFREAPYLKLLGVLVALAALMGGVLDYAFKAEAAATFTSSESLMGFFAIFYTVTGLITVIAQTSLNKKVLEWLGIGGTIALLPAAVVVSSGLGAAFTRLWTVVLARGVEYVMSNSLYQSGYQLLFTPLAPEKKRPTKTVIDVGFDRLGTALGSGMVLAAVALSERHATLVSLLAAVAASIVAMWVALRLNRGYVHELAASLKSGRVKLADSDVIDATTRRTLADTTMAIDREQLLAQIEQLRQSTHPDSLDSGDETSEAHHGAPLTVLVSEDARALLDPIDDLLSRDVARARRVLRPPLDPKLTPFVIPLLGSDDLGRAARRVLRQAAPRIVGQLVDALLDESQDPVVRRRLPDIIKTVGDERAAAGLMLALGAKEPVVRERSARALADLVRAEPALAPPREAVFAAVERELRSEEVWLPRVFMFLEISLDREPLRLALSALRSDDVNLRGTSYEYLENVLPESLRAILWPHLKAYAGGDVARPAGRPRRSPDQLVDALRSVEGLALDPKALSPPRSS